jgi:iron complex outermembrane recepter protein
MKTKAALLTAAVSLATQSAHAQSSLMLEEVVVTAQKRAQSLEDVPIAVSAVDGGLVDSGIVTMVADLDKLVPAARVTRSEGQNRMFLRGVGFTVLSLGGDGSVAFHTDGVIMSRPSVQLSAFYDVERIEVLRGPQGTLYGRNATAGSVNIITRGPTEEFEARASASYGNYDDYTLEGAISGPLSDRVQSRLAFKKLTRNEGYGQNIVTGDDIDDADTLSVRWKTLFMPSDTVDVTLSLDYHEEDDNNYAAYTRGGLVPGIELTGVLEGGQHTGTPFRSATASPPVNDREFWGSALTIDWDVADDWTFKSITGYRESERENSFDIGGSNGLVNATNVFRSEDQDQFTQEFQLTYSTDSLTALFGVYYHDETIIGGGFLDIAEYTPTGVFHEEGGVDIEALGIFGQVNFDITDALNLTLGLRYSDEERDTTGHFGRFRTVLPEGAVIGFAAAVGIPGPVPGEAYAAGPFHCDAERRTDIPEQPTFCNLTQLTGDKDEWDAWTPEAKLAYTFESGTMVYASASRGFKSGLVLVGSDNPPVDPEFLDAYEIGMKTRLWDERVRLDLTGFYYDYEDLQVGVVQGPSVVTENAGEAEVKGIEFELHALLSESLTLNMSGAWVDSEYTEYTTADPELGGAPADLSGNQLSNSPEYSFNIGLTYDHQLGNGAAIGARLAAAWKDEIFFDSFNRPELKSDSYTIVDADVSYTTTDEKWLLGLYGRNLGDEDVPVSGSIGSGFFGFPVNQRYTVPRTYGVRVQYTF